MFSFLKKGFGMGVEVDFAALVQQGARIVDVRTQDEFRDGHIDGSVNIPVGSLPGRLAEIKRDRPVITCCASGFRSTTAKRILEAAGFPQVYNGGGWRGLQGQLTAKS